MERIPFPRLKGEFVTVYRPKGDVYRGLPSFFFTPGSYYENWTVNDFSILNDGGHWHLTGITHPTPPDFVDDFHPGQSWHDAEHMLFHATARGKTFAGVMLDVDRFKSINDRFGHSEGDKALKVTAGILKRSRLDREWVFRFAGDEFVVLKQIGRASCRERV